jgi:hypothetical protein
MRGCSVVRAACEVGTSIGKIRVEMEDGHWAYLLDRMRDLGE